MKNLTFTLLLSFCSFLALAQGDKKAQDREAILAMCGCYEVTFNFAETFSPDTAYQYHENYRSSGLEWVTPITDSEDFVSLQHLLIVGDEMIVKHWRQDWIYENTDLYLFSADKKWRYTSMPQEEVAGQWTQKVFQVDDSPRYEGTATWVHFDGRHFWENTTPAPLPRREFSKRSDYNLMERRNRHEITSWGHVHEQDNQKILRSEAGDELIAAEKGMNTYRKVEDSRCQAAMDWWEDNAQFWADVRSVWDEVFARNKDLVLAKSVDDKPLFMHLFPMGTEFAQAEEYDSKAAKQQIEATIQQFIVE